MPTDQPSSEPDRRTLLIGALLVAISALLFSSKAIVVKCAYPYGVDALALLALRMGFALPIFLALWIREEHRATTRLSVRAVAGCIGLGILGYYAASFLDFEGLRFIGVGLERMVLYLYPTIVVLAGVLFMGHRLTPVTVAALVTTYLGIGLTCAGQRGTGPDTAIGIALVAGSALAYAMAIG